MGPEARLSFAETAIWEVTGVVAGTRPLLLDWMILCELWGWKIRVDWSDDTTTILWVLPFASMRYCQKVNSAMFVQTVIGCQISHLYWKKRVNSTKMIIRFTVTIKTTSGIIIIKSTKLSDIYWELQSFKQEINIFRWISSPKSTIWKKCTSRKLHM